jgi:hypothetical protein
MKKILFPLFIAILVLFAAGCIHDAVSGNGNVKTQNREVSAFNSIRVSGGYEVYLQRGEKESLDIEADENILPVIISEVKDSVLEIYSQKTIFRSKKQKLIITCSKLKSLDLSGATDLKSDSLFVLNNLDITISGAAKIDMKVDADKLNTEVSGSAELVFSGKANEFATSISGAGKINGEKLEVKKCNIEISGMGEAKVNAKEKLDVTISGMGEVEYYGNPQINQSISGAGKVKKLE